MQARELMEIALRARERAYAPYSGFLVGAALLTPSGKVYTGCNVESAAYAPTCCAERTALVKAVSEGERSFAAIAVAGGNRSEDGRTPCPPCGVCRQFLREFCGGELKVYLADGEKILSVSLGELLPMSFGKERLGGES
ncbi:MAG: cytidine deaminase [Christensenellaceae bacterium]